MLYRQTDLQLFERAAAVFASITFAVLTFFATFLILAA